MKISPARVAAFDILKRIETERAFSSVLLPEYEAVLSPKDRSLCHQLTLGVLRKQIYLDRIIDHLADGKRLDTAIRIILRLGLFQLKFLGKVPDHSAVDESVNLVQRAKKSSAKGFVNAILRRSLREPFVFEVDDPVERLSVEASHPRWLIERWIDQFGFESAKALAHANNELPRLSFRLTPKSKPGSEFDGIRRSDLIESSFVADRFTVELLTAVERGEIYFQDEGSQLVAQALELRPGASFLDVCAAPGSKVSQVAADSTVDRGMIVAGDLHESRVRFLKQNCVKQGVEKVSLVQYDAERALPFENESFDVVLVDAPCSGTGTIRHNPEIRYSLDRAHLAELSRKQREILINASKAVRKGGLLVYSTCSLEPEENELVAGAFVSESNGFQKTIPTVPESFRTPEGYARTRPDRDRIDGFFIAAFRAL